MIADSAYPAQARSGIDTIVTPVSHLEVVQDVLATLAKTKHLRPIVYLDEELKYIQEVDAPGISAHRDRLSHLVRFNEAELVGHDSIISRLDRAGRRFRVLVIKTGLALPYTSVFFELDCAYWSRDAERNLRAKIASSGNPARA